MIASGGSWMPLLFFFPFLVSFCHQHFEVRLHACLIFGSS